MTVTSNYFGRTEDGREVYEYLLENSSGMRAAVLEYGCVVKNLWVKDSAGRLRDVVLGYNTLADYEKGTSSQGSFVGRYANRIEKSTFTLDGKTYPLTPNDGPNHLHGTLGRHVFHGSVQDDKLVLTTVSPDGEDGFPGNLDITVTYILTESGALVMDYVATTDRPTILNFTNHTYFNLDGCDAPSVLHQTLRIVAKKFTEGNAETCPTGRILPVAGTPFDFTAAKPIGREIDTGDEQLRMASGYDHNFVLDKEPGALTLAAAAHSSVSGITMEACTTQPGMQLYTGNFLACDTVPGKDGKPFAKNQGFCLETQHYPCTPSHPEFPSVVLRQDEEYHETTFYKFYTE